MDNEECSLIQQQLDERKLARSDSTPEERCLREIRRPSDGGSVDGAFGGGSIDEKRARAVLTVPHDKGETIVFSDGASWIACDTGTDTVTLLQVRSLDPEPLGLANLEISINVLTAPVDPWGPAWKSLEDSFGKVVNDYHFGVGRVPAGVSSLTWRFNYRKEPTETVEAEFRDGYWVMQHLTEPHRRIFDRATVTATYDDGRTEEFRLFEWTSPPDFDHICAQINHGC